MKQHFWTNKPYLQRPSIFVFSASWNDRMSSSWSATLGNYILQLVWLMTGISEKWGETHSPAGGVLPADCWCEIPWLYKKISAKMGCVGTEEPKLCMEHSWLKRTAKGVFGSIQTRKHKMITTLNGRRVRKVVGTEGWVLPNSYRMIWDRAW